MPPSGIRHPVDPKGPLFGTFQEIHCWPTEPKNFLKAPLAPIYTNFEGERAQIKNAIFLTKIASFLFFRRARRINLVDLKKSC